MTGRPSNENSESGEQDTGLPGLKSWAAVYWVAIGTLVLWVVLLTLFMRRYS
jgi:hypothetical protein